MKSRFSGLTIVELAFICSGLCLLGANLKVCDFKGEVLNPLALESLKNELMNELKTRP